MKDILIVLFLLAFGFLAGIYVQRKYPEWTQRCIPGWLESTQRIYPLLEAGPSGVKENRYKLILHEGGGVTWEKQKSGIKWIISDE